MNRSAPPRHFVRPLLLLVSALVLSGCGQTGALYLPDQPRPGEARPSEARPEEQAPAEAESAETD